VQQKLKQRFGLPLLAMATVLFCTFTPVHATKEKPNILVIMPDDVGYFNLSAYNHGAMGYLTPNIDRIAKDGALFTDQYAQPSCTAGRAAFITGMYPIRSGMTTVGMVGSPLGLKAKDATLAEVLKTVGYATGQFGKNHLGDRNEHLPTVHGFDEFYGHLYHLNVLQEPLDNDYPHNPEFFAKFGPRGILHTFSSEKDDPSVPDKRFGKVGKQTIKDTGQVTKERLGNLDTEYNQMAFKFMEKARADNKPFFVWLNPARMHVFNVVPEKYHEKAREFTSYDDPHGAGMIQHDEDTGKVLDKLDELGLTENTIVIYTTDNGPEHSTYPQGGTTPFRSEKMTTWEGGVRVPMLIRWPGKIKPGGKFNGIQAHMDLFTTLAATAGVDPDGLKTRLMKGDTLGTDTEKKCYLDGVNNLDYWTGKSDKSARDDFIYWAEASPQAVRVNQWKAHFSTRDGYYGTTTKLEIPWVFNLRQDPFESYNQAPIPPGSLPQHKSWMFNVIVAKMGAHMKTLMEFPPSQKPTSLSIEKLIDQSMSKDPTGN
jgi:arylsulfatase